MRAYLCNLGISDTPPPLQDDEPPEEVEGGQDEVDPADDEVDTCFVDEFALCSFPPPTVFSSSPTSMQKFNLALFTPLMFGFGPGPPRKNHLPRQSRQDARAWLRFPTV